MCPSIRFLPHGPTTFSKKKREEKLSPEQYFNVSGGNDGQHGKSTIQKGESDMFFHCFKGYTVSLRVLLW